MRGARIVWNLVMAIPAALWIRRQRADIVYTNAVTTNVGALAAWLTGRKHVWHIRELGYGHNRLVYDLGQKRAMRLVRSLSTVCLANSHCVAEKYRNDLRPTEIKVVYQGVQLDEAARGPEPPPSVGFRCVIVGTIGPFKRQEEAIEALARLKDHGHRAELLIVGEGVPDYEQQLRDLVREHGLEEQVSFLGQLDSAAPVIKSADAVVTCSRDEAFGRVTVEGMLAGKPVVGARSAGTAELIDDGVNGFLYEPGDVGQLTGILQRLIEDPAEARRIGEAARTWAAERFTEERYGEELLACLLPLSETARTP